jgi:beta-carotene 3-hydroxylase
MKVLLNFGFFLVGLVGMEVVAYLTHKYLMHGPLWFLHKSHHVPHEGHLEKNDWFGIFFALPSIGLIYLGTHGYPPLLWIGLGMAAYGAFYFGFHDIIVHRRIPSGIRPKSPAYVKRLIQAHHIHHWTKERDGAVSFGFLYAPPIEKLRAQLRETRSVQGTSTSSV